MNTLSDRLGHTFQNPQLLTQALTHRSYYFENRAHSSAHFERFEFLGDAVLDLVVSEILMLTFPQTNEGALSKWRASLVNETTLSEIALELQLSEEVLLGKSEARDRSQLRPRMLASVFEAVVAALYLDGGLSVARRFLENCFQQRLDALDTEIEYVADFKSRLQEFTQKSFHAVPDYQLVASDGPEHAKTFSVEVWIEGKKRGSGKGLSRKAAEQAAAENALKEIEESHT